MYLILCVSFSWFDLDQENLLVMGTRVIYVPLSHCKS